MDLIKDAVQKIIQVVRRVVQIAQQAEELVEQIDGKGSEQPHTMSTQRVESTGAMATDTNPSGGVSVGRDRRPHNDRRRRDARAVVGDVAQPPVEYRFHHAVAQAIRRWPSGSSERALGMTDFVHRRLRCLAAP
jgi:hypothetical protein